MFTDKKYTWSLALMLLGVCVLAGAVFISGAHAQESSPASPDTGCISCHENLYYIHDTGNWFCQCAEQMTCTCCHGGNPEALTEQEAHAGMDLFPTRHDAQTCQECHPQDYQARVDQFARVAGVSSFHPPAPTYAAPVSDPPADVPPASGLAARLLQPWRLTGLILLAIATGVIAVFGYRCLQADCLAKIKK